MIKIENVDVHGFDASIRGMRSPMNSWDKSDSGWCHGNLIWWNIGENDLKLMKSLSKAGNDHAKFLRMINVTCDITAPLYWWKEFKTYRAGKRFGDCEPDIIDCGYLEYDIEMNSCSTMHKISAKGFTLDDFSHEHIGDVPNCDPLYYAALEGIIVALNEARHCFLDTKDKKYWWQMIQLLPSSYNQRRTVQLNYQVLKSMYFARKNHKLDEWREFCSWIETLPYFKKIVLED